jgi:hypothetical protein
MRNSLPGYYRPRNEVLKEIWGKCIFVLDTSVLFGLYRYPKEAHGKFIKTFSQISDRLWIPHQVALEYQENRLSVISEQLGKFDKVIEIITETQSNLKNKLDELQLERRHSVINPDNFLIKISNVFQEFKTELETLRKEQPDLSDEDVIRSEIDNLLENKIGTPSTIDELNKLYDEGKDRYEQRRPPGYLDKGKSKQDEQFHFWGDLAIKREFGDLIIWYQLIKEATSRKLEHVIFITDDNKDDWWWKYKGKKIGARPELVQEIQQKAGVKSFYMYDSARFLEYAKEYLGAEINQETINQVKEISELQKNSLSRFSSMQNRALQVEKLVYKWIQSRFDGWEINWHERFPDFILFKDSLKIAYEVKYFRVPRNIFMRWRDVAYRGYYEVSKGKYDVFYIALVIDHDQNSEIHRWVKNLEIPEGIRIHVFEAFYSDDEVVDLHFVQELPNIQKFT